MNRDKPNILVLCIDQWDRHMEVPADLELPALDRLEAEGVSFDRQYCTVPVCTPSRATMWTGMHAKKVGLWDNTNFSWTDELTMELPTVGHMLRDQGYYTAFKGKWHLSDVPKREGALERYGFSDYQQWGDMFGAPLQGEMLDAAAAFETADWLRHKATALEQPWMVVSSLINPHDVMFLQTGPEQQAHPNSSFGALQSQVQELGWFQKEWDISLPDNFNDDLSGHPPGVRDYKAFIEANYGEIPADREDLWRIHRNYLINAMRLVDAQFMTILNTMDELELWENTVVIYTSDHGEMNGAHRMTQKGGITFDEATVVNLTAVVPGGPKGTKTSAVGSHLDLAPTLLDFAGLNPEEMSQRYPQLKGRSLKPVMLGQDPVGPRGSSEEPGDGALICWDGLHALDYQWGLSGALAEVTDLGEGGKQDGETTTQEKLEAVGRRFGAPDFAKRNFFRAVVDGRYKLVRWFSPEDYELPTTVDELYDLSDVGLYDLENDPGELENIGHRDHPDFDRSLVAAMLEKLHALVRWEMGEDGAPFDLDLFGTREIKYERDSTDQAGLIDHYSAWSAEVRRMLRGQQGDGYSCVVERRFAAPIQRLWQAFTDPKDLSRWLATPTGDLQKGQTITLDMQMPESTQVKILDCEPPQRLRATWKYGEFPDSEVELSLRADGKHTLVRIEHFDSPTSEDARGGGSGWENGLYLLEFFLDGQPLPKTDDIWSAMERSWADISVDSG